MITDAKLNDYMQKFHRLQTTVLSQIDDGFKRHAAVVEFNERFYQHWAKDQTILSAVAYVPRIGADGVAREGNALAKLVMDYLAQTRWVATYGLSYLETMELTYAEWVKMQQTLNLHGQSTLPTDNNDG